MNKIGENGNISSNYKEDYSVSDKKYSIYKLHDSIKVIPQRSKKVEYLNKEQINPQLIKKGYDLIKNFPAKDIDDRQFAHIFGNQFISNTPLEGSEFTSTISYFVDFLQHALPDTEESKKIYEQFLACAAFFKQRNCQADINHHAFDLTNSLLNLESGEKLLLPGGYVDLKSKSGHSMLYEFKMMLGVPPLLQLRIVNTGDGIQYHQAAGLKGKLKYCPVLRVENIPLNPISIQLFCQGIIECTNPLQSSKGLHPPYDAEYLYTKVIPCLRGNVVLENSRSSDIITAQNAGICSERVLHAYMRNFFIEQLGEREGLKFYKSFIYSYKMHALVNFSARIKQSRQWNETEKVLLTNAIRKQYIALSKLDILDSQREEYRSILHAIEDLTQYFHHASHSSLPINSDQDKFNFFDSFFLESPKPIYSFASGSVKNPNLIEFESQLYPPENKEEFVEQTHVMMNYLKEMSAENVLSPSELRKAILLFDRYLGQIPVPVRGEKDLFWEGIDSGQAEIMMKEISVIGDNILRIITRLKEIDPEFSVYSTFFSQNLMLAIMHKLGTLISDSPVGKCKMDVDFVILNKFIIPADINDPQRMNRWSLILDYLCDSKTCGLDDEDEAPFLSLNHFVFNARSFNPINLNFLDFGGPTPKFFLSFLKTTNPDSEMFCDAMSDSDLEVFCDAMSDFAGNIVPLPLALLQKYYFQTFFLKEYANQGSHFKVSEVSVRTQSDEFANERRFFFEILTDGKIFEIQKKFKMPLELFKENFPEFTDEDLLNILFYFPIEYQKKGEFLRNCSLVSQDSSGSCINFLNYFRTEFDVFSQRSFQLFSFHILFSKDNLIKELKNNTQFIDAFTEFLNEGYDHFHAMKDISGMLFFLEMSEYLKKTIEISGNVIPSNLLDRQEELTLMFQTTRNLDDLGLISMHLLNTYKDRIENSFSEEERAVILEAWILQEIFYGKNKNNLKMRTENETIFVKDILTPALMTDCADRIISRYSGKREQLKWESEGSIYRARDGGRFFEIDFSKPLVNIQGIPTAAALPLTLKNNPSFKKLIKDKVCEIKNLEINTYSITFEDPKEEIIVIDGKNDIIIRKRIKSKNVELLDEQKVSFLPEALKRPGNQYWYTCEARYKQKLFIADSSGKVKYIVVIEGPREDQRHIKKIILADLPEALKGKGKFEYLPLDSISVTKIQEFEYLNGFEEWDEINLWVNRRPTSQSDVKALLELNRFGLTFQTTLDEFNYINVESIQDPDFNLAFPKIWHGLGGLKGYYLLKHKEKGFLKVCLPKMQLKSPEKKARDLTLQSIPVRDDSLLRQPMYMFDLDSHEKLIAKNTEQRLYLIYLYLSMGRNPEYVELAKEEIAEVWKTNAYTNEELEIFGWIFKKFIKEENTAINPDVSALVLKLAANLERNLNSRPFLDLHQKMALIGDIEEKDYQNLLRKAFSSYLNGLNARPDLKLPFADEQVVLKKIGPDNLLNQKIKSRDLPGPLPIDSDSFTSISTSLNDLQYKEKLIARAISQSNYKAESSVTFPGKDLKSNFYTWLQWAFQGNAEQKLELSIRLEMMSFSPFDKHLDEYRYLHGLLKLILEADPQEFKQFTFPEVNGPDEYKNREVVKKMLKLLFPEKSFSNYISYKHPQGQIPGTQEIEKVLIKKTLRKKVREERKMPPSKQPLELKSLPPLFQKFSQCIESSTDSSTISPRYFDTLKYTGVKDGWVKDYEGSLEKLRGDQKKSEKYSIKDLDGLKENLMHEINLANRSSEIEQKKLLSAANKLPINEPAYSIALSRRLAKYENTFKTTDTLLVPFINGNLHVWQKTNPHLTSEEVEGLNQSVFDHLCQEIVQQSRFRMLKIVEKIELIKDDPEGTLKKSLEEQLNQEIISIMNFSKFLSSKEISPDRLRIYAAFAYAADIAPRKKQLDLLEKLLDGIESPEANEFIAQLVMGGGKSKVILPILALHIADGERCAIITVPKELVETQKEYMNKITGGFFDVEANTLDFDRDTPLTTFQIGFIRDTLERVTSNGEYLIVTPETMKSLSARYVELHKMYEELSLTSDETQAFKDLAFIQDFLMNKGFNILDEGDTILSPRRELSYSLGSPSKIPSSSIDIEVEIYSLLAQPPLSELIKISQNEQGANIQASLNEIKEKIASHFAKKFASSKQKKELQDYLLEKTKEIPAWIEKLSKEERDAIGLVRGQLKTYLPLTLSKQGYRDYAFSRDPSCIYAIPAVFCQPLEGSYFGTPEEAMNYTIQHMLQTGIRVESVGRLVALLRSEVVRDLKNKVPENEIKALKDFHELFPNLSLFEIEEKDWETIAKAINNKPDKILFFTKKFILPEIKVHPFKITNNSFDYICGFKKVFGFTGTPWNSHAWHPRIKVLVDEGTEVKMDALLRKKAEELVDPIRECTLSFKKSKNPLKTAHSLVEQILKPFEKEPHFCALIDTGALLKGFNEKILVDALLLYCKKHRPDIKGVCCRIDKELKIKLLDGSIIPESEWRLPREQLFSLYTASDFIGTDILQPSLGVSVSTLSEDLYHKDLAQGASRMRDLINQQNNYYVGSKDCLESIKNKSKSVEMTVDVLLSRLEDIQRIQQKEDVFRAAQNIPSVIRNIVLQKIAQLHARGDFQKAHEIFKVFDIEGLFVSDQSFEPWEQNKGIEDMVSPDEFLRDLQKEWIDKMENLVFDQSSPQAEMIKSLKVEIIRDLNNIEFPDNDRLPETVPTQSQSKLNCQVQLQKQTQSQAQTEKENKQEMDREFRRNAPWLSNLEPSAEKLRNPVLFNSLETLFSDDTEIKEFAPYFDIPFIVTYNHSPRKFPLFTISQKPFNHMMVELIQDAEHPFQFYVLEDEELKEFRSKYNGSVFKNGNCIQNYSNLDIRENKLSSLVFLYATGARIAYDSTTGQGIDPQWQQHPDFKKAEIQLRILNGEVYYRKEDLPFLESFIKKMGSKKFLTLFKIIIKSREARARFEGSTLAEVIAKVAKEEEFLGKEAQNHINI